MVTQHSNCLATILDTNQTAGDNVSGQFYLQSIEVRQPNTVSPAQIPAKMIVADINGFQIPSFIPEEVQNINTLKQNSFTLTTHDCHQSSILTASA